MKAVLHYNAGPGWRVSLDNKLPTDWQVVVVDETDRESFRREMRDADVLLHVLETVRAADIAAAPQLKLIQKIGVGVDAIDLAAAERHGVRVANMPGTNSQAVCEMALGLMLSVLRQIAVLDAHTRRGEGWSLPPRRFERSGEIAGRTVGLVGFGEVPQKLTPALHALGAKIIYFDRVDYGNALADRHPLEEVLKADIVSLHVPLVPEMRHLVRHETIAAMKDGAVLINTARGGLVNDVDLADALRSGKLLGAGLDVFSSEPLDQTNPLLALENIVLTPHVSWLTPETITRSLDVALENARRIMAGESLLHQIRSNDN